MKKIIIIVGIAVVVIIAALVAVYFLFLRGDAPEKEVELTYYSPGEYFVTNVKDSKKLLKVSVILGVDDVKLAEKLGEKNYIIRDEIIFMLREITEERFNSQNIRQELSTEIRDKLNEVLKTESINEIRFNDFVMQ